MILLCSGSVPYISFRDSFILILFMITILSIELFSQIFAVMQTVVHYKIYLCLWGFGELLDIFYRKSYFTVCKKKTPAFTPCGTRNQHPIRNIWFSLFFPYRTWFRAHMIQNICFLHMEEHLDHCLFSYRQDLDEN